MRKPFARAATLTILTAIMLTGAAGSALACGGLVTPNGTINLLKTTTLAAYHDGIEHYVTSFEFAGEGQEVGSIIPLPGVPTDVIKGGDWTLQRLILETQPQPEALRTASFALDSAAGAEVLMEKKIDALDITVLKGGAVEVGDWAREHGYFLPARRAGDARLLRRAEPDLPRRSVQRGARGEPRRADRAGHTHPRRDPDAEPVGAAADPGARPQGLGGRAGGRVPAHGPAAGDTSPGRALEGIRREPARTDPGGQRAGVDARSSPICRSDRGMKWLPESGMWLTYIRINETAANLKHDLAIDASGYGRPSPVAAGYPAPGAAPWSVVWTVMAALVAVAFLMVLTDPAVRRQAARVFRR